jgi:nitrogen-specific signal transduction histidine kinase
MINIPVSTGELIDKLSILHVKKIKINDESKLEYVNKEFELLYNMSSEYLSQPEIETLYHSLVTVNSELWNIEDELRVLETRKSFNVDFIELARKVYFTNDKRFELKNEINKFTDSEIREVKDYVKYD